jgi:hypothetical protein
MRRQFSGQNSRLQVGAMVAQSAQGTVAGGPSWAVDVSNRHIRMDEGGFRTASSFMSSASMAPWQRFFNSRNVVLRPRGPEVARQRSLHPIAGSGGTSIALLGESATKQGQRQTAEPAPRQKSPLYAVLYQRRRHRLKTCGNQPNLVQ